MRVALLTNFVPPYRVPLFEALAARVGALRVFVSTPMERDRTWAPVWGRLDVAVQRSISFRRRWRHPHGFEDTTQVHVPWDTLGRLARFRPDAVISGELGARTLFAALHGLAHPRVPLLPWLTLSEVTERALWARVGMAKPVRAKARKKTVSLSNAITPLPGQALSVATVLRRRPAPAARAWSNPKARAPSDASTVASARGRSVSKRWYERWKTPRKSS